jgi:hypothetical protein
MSSHACGRQSAAAGSSSRSYPSEQRGSSQWDGTWHYLIGESSVPGRLTRTREGRGSERARADRVGGVWQLREPTLGTSLGSEGPQCWSIGQFHKRVMCRNMCRYVQTIKVHWNLVILIYCIYILPYV